MEMTASQHCSTASHDKFLAFRDRFWHRMVANILALANITLWIRLNSFLNEISEINVVKLSLSNSNIYLCQSYQLAF